MSTCWSETMTAARRCRPIEFGATEYATVAGPCPCAPERVIQGASARADQAHSRAVSTARFPFPPLAGRDGVLLRTVSPHLSPDGPTTFVLVEAPPQLPAENRATASARRRSRPLGARESMGTTRGCKKIDVMRLANSTKTGRRSIHSGRLEHERRRYSTATFNRLAFMFRRGLLYDARADRLQGDSGVVVTSASKLHSSAPWACHLCAGPRSSS